jgi:hypothetical protein
VSANPSEIYTAPQSWAQPAFPKLLPYGRTPKGCHFAAWEQPKSSPMRCAPLSRRYGRDTTHGAARAVRHRDLASAAIVSIAMERSLARWIFTPLALSVTGNWSMKKIRAGTL